MADIKACFSSKTDNWATPQDFFDKLNEEFHFTLDPCADEVNHKCDLYYTREQDGLSHSWGGTRFSAILLMEKRLPTGFVTRMSKAASLTRLWLCLSRLALIQNTSTTTFMVKQRFASFVVV